MRRLVVVKILPALLVAGAASGCGTATYQERLQKTSDWYQYEYMLDQNLAKSGSWNNAGINFRAPLQFQPIPAPQPQVDEEGNPLPIQQDPRQPDYLSGNVQLPGLAGAWRANLKVDPPQPGQPEVLPGFLYAMSNYEFFLDKESEVDPAKFHEDVTGAVASALGVPFPEANQWKTQQLPKQGGFRPQQRFEVMQFQPTPLGLGGRYNVSLWLQQAGQEIRTAFLWVIPENVSSQEKLSGPNNRIQLSMETLEVNPEKPTAGGGQAVGF